jgi:hypothetical protein
VKHKKRSRGRIELAGLMYEKLAATPPRSRECVVFLDENMSSPEIAEILRQLDGWRIEIHLDHLTPGTSDEDVANFCGPRGWAVVTCDDMRYTPETKLAMLQQHVRVFKVVRHDDTHGLELAAALVTARKSIIGMMRKNRTAMCAHVRLNGDVNVVRYFDDVALSLSPSQLKTYRKYGKV